MYYSFDALVLIHADFDESEMTRKYITALKQAIGFFRNSNKPIFRVRSKDVKESCISDILDGLPEIPSSYHRAQDQIDFMSAIIGESPENIRLAIGGMYAAACVYAHAAAWCTSIETSYTPDPDCFCKEDIAYPEKPIGLGKILDEIVIDV